MPIKPKGASDMLLLFAFLFSLEIKDFKHQLRLAYWLTVCLTDCSLGLGMIRTL
jgi:hypothetical protein